jgi:hypothetical protein
VFRRPVDRLRDELLAERLVEAPKEVKAERAAFCARRVTGADVGVAASGDLFDGPACALEQRDGDTGVKGDGDAGRALHTTNVLRASHAVNQMSTEAAELAALQAADRLECERDPLAFLERHVTIEEPNGTVIPLGLWPFQRKTVDVLTTETLTIVLKARRLGLSWIARARALWLAIFRPGIRILILCKTEGDATELLDRIRRMRDRLAADPAARHILAPLQRPAKTRDAVTTLDIGPSTIRALVGTPAAARSETAGLVIWDEAAFQQHAEDIWQGLLPTIEGGGRLWIISTGNGLHGRGSMYAELWQNAVRKANGFASLFWPWDARPDRDPAWKIRQVAAIGSDDRFRVEYPECLTAEVRVSTERGILPIVDALECQETESGSIVASGPQPVSEVFKLTTKAGRVIRGTHNHPVHTPDGFVWLSQLEPGQQVTLRAPRFASSEYTQEWSPIPGARASVQIDEWWGRFIGYFMGDGSWHADCISVVCDAKDEDVIADVGGLLTSLVSEPHARTHQRVQGRKGAVEWRVNSIRSREVFAELGLIQRNGEDRWKRRVGVPDCIWRSPRPIVREFLSGLFEADAGRHNGRVTFSTCKLEFARDVQLLLLGFEIPVSIRAITKLSGADARGVEHEYTQYVMALGIEASKRFDERIGFVSQRKRTYTGATSGRGRPPAPITMLDEVVEIVSDGTEVTYDLTVEPEHVFSANGILTHNTPDDAFIVASGTPVYSREGIAAAVRLGREFDARREAGTMTPPVDGVLYPAADFGEHSHVLVLWPLEAGGFYVTAEHPFEHSEPDKEAPAVARLVNTAGVEHPIVDWVRFDASRPESARMFIRTFRPAVQGPAKLSPVPFGQMTKRGSFKRLSILYLRRLFNRTAAGERIGVIAISPSCTRLIGQLEALQFKDDDSEDVVKLDDHGPDALIAGVAPEARRFSKRLEVADV